MLVDMPYEKTIDRVTEELKKEGFGVLTTIDVKETLKRTRPQLPPSTPW